MAEKTKNPFTKILIFAAVLVVIIAVLLIVLLGGKTTEHLDIQKGIAYIKNREAADVTEIENAIFENKKAEMLAEIEEKLAEDSDYVWTALSQINTVFMGESRVDAYNAFGFVDSDHCMAERGASIKVIPEYYEALQVVNPKLIVMQFGLNDVGWYWDTPEEFADELMGYVDEIHGFLPDCKIYIQSTLYPLDEQSVEDMYDTEDLFNLVHVWNERAKEIYLENGYDYHEIGWLVEENQNLYQYDGVHFEPEFYPLLASEILKQYMADMMTNE